MWIRALAECDARCGGKAHGLARLLRAGLHVPAGFVIGHDPGDVALAELGHTAAALEQIEIPPEAIAAAHTLGGPFAVRSSASLEDGATGSAAGLFSSHTGVAIEGLAAAIRAVLASALAPMVASYARGRRVEVCVIVQRYVEGERSVVYTRPPGGGDEMWIQRAGMIEKRPRDELAARIEAVIDAPRGADIERVDDWIVQARPIVHPVIAARVPPPPSVLAILDDGRRWTWDIAHNPDPLSTAQAGLVERIARDGIAELRVCAGYLYASSSTPRARTSDDVTTIEDRLAEILDGDDDAELEDVLDRYLAFYEVWRHELSPLVIKRAERASFVEATLVAAAHGEITEAAALADLGVLAPAWDVAVPTYGERPWLVRDAIARAKALPSSGARREPDLGERDDIWFAKAQWLVRHAILERASALGISAVDAFWIPLDELVAGIDAVSATRRAAAHRAAAERATAWTMPVVVGGDPPPDGPVLHGVGTGPRVTGRVVRFASLASAIAVGAGDVVVARAITPALAVLVVGCAAIVSETGGPLDHGAAMARELGITCVVGCRDAWSLLSDGMFVSVDGDAGVVTC